MRSSASGRMERGGFFPFAAPLSTSARTSNSWSRVSSMWRRQALEASVCCARVWRCGARASAARKKQFSGERECFLVFIFFFPLSSTMPPLGTDADATLRSILDVTLVQAAASPSGPLFLADLAKVK